VKHRSLLRNRAARLIPAFLSACAALSAQSDPVFKSAVSLVQVDVEVTAIDGRVVDGLTKSDFRVLDEGKPQGIVSFVSEQQSLDLILLFDISGSMRPVVREVASAARQAFTELRKGDRVALMVFNTRSRIAMPFTEDLDEIDRGIRDIVSERFGGGTLIQSAVDDAALEFRSEKRNQRRRAVLIITDDVGVRTRREATVVHDFWESDALLSGLIVRNTGYQALHTAAMIMGPQNLLMQAGMKGIAAKTGGDVIHADDAGPAFQDAIHRIRTRYSLYYPLPEAKPSSLRTVRVELADAASQKYPKAHVRSRTGYIVPGEGMGLPERRRRKPAPTHQ
jgi:VWFA-related protein